MSTDPIGGLNAMLGGDSTGGMVSASGKTGTYFDKDMFLQLLVAQLKYQNPAKPVDQSEFMNQAATLANVEQTQAMSEAVAQSASWQRSLAASSLVGKQVTAIAADGSTVTGVVQRAALTSTEASVVIDGLSVPLTGVTSIESASTT